MHFDDEEALGRSGMREEVERFLNGCMGAFEKYKFSNAIKSVRQLDDHPEMVIVTYMTTIDYMGVIVLEYDRGKDTYRICQQCDVS